MFLGWIKRTAITVVLALGASIVCFSQEPAAPDLQKEIEALKQEQQEMRKELQQIKMLLQRLMTPRSQETVVRGVQFELGNNPIRGKDTAKVTLIDFTDYQ
jgi:Tfp pilus assembly protein PilN